jgi:hypothetical protein
MTKQPPRIQVQETQRYLGDLEGPLDGLIRELQSLSDEGWEGIVMEYDQWSQDHPDPYLYRHRPETDKEYEKRMKELGKKKAEEIKAKERRRKEYEKLKKEFEGEQ